MAALKILHIIDSLEVGGAERLLAGIVNGLNDYDNHLIILGGSERLLPEFKNLRYFGNLGASSLPGIFSKVREVRRHIRSQGINIVHSHLFVPGLFSRLVCPEGVALFNSIHSIPSIDIYRASRLNLWLEKLTYRKRHHILGVSRAVLEDFDRVVGIRGKADVLYNFIDDKYWKDTVEKGPRGSGLRLVSVGNLRPPKNYLYALEAFKDMPGGVTLDIYGDGELRGVLEERIRRDNLPIRLCGISDEVDRILPSYDAFLMTSLYEGQPLSLLEAMASGLPVLLSDIPVLRETAGENALYFSLTDPGSLVRVVKSVLSGEVDMTGIARRGRENVQRMAKKEAYFKQLRNLYLNS
jgi:glycosyltransferase involved in cell wall biosynthesis